MHATRTLHYGNLKKAVKTRAKPLFRFTPLASNYRFLENSHAKRTSHKQCEGELCKKLDKIHKKQAKNHCAQNATPVEETQQRANNATPVEEMLKSVQNATPVEEMLKSAQNATPVEETPHKRTNATPVEETSPRCSIDASCRQNRTSMFRMQALSHKLYLS